MPKYIKKPVVVEAWQVPGSMTLANVRVFTKNNKLPGWQFIIHIMESVREKVKVNVKHVDGL